MSMSKVRKQFSRDFKIKVVLAYKPGVPAVGLSRQFEIHPNVIYNWSREYEAVSIR
jgi:transposase-like protein